MRHGQAGDGDSASNGQLIVMDAELTDGFQEWISSVMYSNWFYAAIAAIAVFFFVMFVFGMVWLFRRNDIPDTAETTTHTDITFNDSALMAALRKPNGKFRKILLAADTIDDLPVTIPVNAAIQLATAYKCLLIDLDTKRDAVARVFDVAAASHTAATRPLPTPIEHLDIWPAHFFSPQRQIDLKWAITLTQHHYDIILINAPYFSTQPDRQRIVQCAESAVIFTKDKKKAAPVLRLLEAEQCSILSVLGPNGHPFF